MPKSALTGTRIRERRIMLGMKQTDLARLVEISPSYLNLIEHNRRRIAGKLLAEIAKALAADVTTLTQGAEAELLGQLADAASGLADIQAEMDRLDEFAGRFPGWAALIVAQNRHITELKLQMEALADRLTHDPRLSVAVHEVLSKVAAIRSTATILVETKDIEDSWQERFQRNLFEDSGQLTDSAQALVSFLEGEAGPNMGVEPPRGKVQKYLEEAGFHFPSLEDPDGSEAAISALLDGFEGQDDPFAKRLMESFFIQYRRDASGMPRSDLMRHIAEFGFDPSLIAQNFDQTVAAACRRLACLPTGDVPAFGYVACDASGLLTWRKPISGFSLPRSGVGCPRWPLFRALGLAGQAVYAFLHQAATSSQKFHAFAAAETVWPEGIFDAPVVQAGMLLIPAECMDSKSSQGEISVGSTCRLCPIDACAARQEPSVLVEGL